MGSIITQTRPSTFASAISVRVLIAARRHSEIDAPLEAKIIGIDRGTDLALIKVAAAGDTRAQVMQLVDVYRARVVDVSPESLVIEATGTEDKIDSLVEVLRPYGVSEMVRTGLVAMARGTGVAGAVADARTSHVAADAQDNLGSYSV